MASADRIITADVSASPSVPSSPAPVQALLPRGAALVVLAVLLFYVGSQGRILWQEWANLQGELAEARQSAVIGYYNIHINPSYARRPDDWCHDEGAHTLLWSGWKHGQGHQWFRIGRGELDLAHVSEPIGRDVIQAIDLPIVEVGGGTIWQRIPEAADVAGHELGGTVNVYPLLLLDKVEVVNDEVADQPFLVTYNPFASKPDRVNVYVGASEGRRVRMGVSGYFHDSKPVFYDRGTESLWVDRGEGLEAVAGSRRGTTLRRVAHPTPTSWGDWRARHPRSRLIVGADRSRPPAEL
ncbi:MAG: DUF3179 domain-containing (seleno)protein [Isosphaeraceae bacterium]|nr:DUF3179 domain-containing (seleno)protein [Isosphaeraceae bacterium]